jgi:transcriptional regulator with XRE-family HTH domain
MKNAKQHYGQQIGTTVKLLRERKNMTQTELQEEAKLSSGYISRLENGEYEAPSIVHILKIANAFGMSLRDFLEYAELVPKESSFAACLRGEGASEEQIEDIIKYKSYVLTSNLKGHS